MQEVENDERLNAYWEALLAQHRTEKDHFLAQRTERMLSRLNARVDAEELMQARRRRFWKIFSIAAAFIAVCGLGLWINMISTPVQVAKVYENTQSEVKRITLPDGSDVCLGREAVLVWSDEKDVRKVSLKGDAYFDIVRDTLRPFVVSTEVVDIKVLGTAFSVSAPTSRTTADVVLERGSVKLISKGGTPLLRLSPNQKASVDMEAEDISVENVYASSLIQQQYNIVSLDNAGVDQIIRAIESTYGVKVVASGYNPASQYHMDFLRSDPIGDVLAILEVLTGGRFSSTNTEQK